MAQVARPTSDISAGSWTDEGTVDNDGNLWTSLDETSQDADSSYIRDAGFNTTSEVRLGSITDPGVGTGHIVHVFFRSIGSGGPERLTIDLVQGTTVIETWANQSNRSGTYTDLNATMTAADSITDYTNLRVRLTASNLGGSEEMRVTQVYLETPDAPAVLDMPNFRIRATHKYGYETTGLNTDSDWAQALNTNASLAPEQIGRIRAEVAATGAKFNLVCRWETRKNGGSWVTLPAPGYPVAASTPAIQFVPSSQFSDGAATTNLLSGSGKTFVAGSGDTSNNTALITDISDAHTEYELAYMIRRLYDGESFNVNGDYFDFRLVESDGTPFTGTYNLPRVTISIPAGLIGGVYAETPRRCGPWMDGNGNLYQLVEFAETAAILCMLKSTDGGDTWVPVDTANNPANTDMESMDGFLENDRIYMAHHGDPAWIHIFRVSTHSTNPDTWETVDSALDATTDAIEQCIALVRRSDGDLIAFYNHTATNDRIYYQINSGAGWGSRTDLEVETGIEWSGLAAVLGENDTAYIIYAGQNGACYYRTLSSSDVLSGRTTIAASGVGSSSLGDRNPVISPVYVNDGGTEKIYFFYKKNADDIIYCRVLTEGSGLGTEAAVTDVAVAADRATSRAPTASAAADGTTVYLIYSRASDFDIYMDKNTGSGWGTDTEILDGVSCDLVSCNIFTHNGGNGGAKVIGFTYANGTNGYTGDVYYAEYEISGAIKEGAAALAGSGSITPAGSKLMVALSALSGAGSISPAGSKLMDALSALVGSGTLAAAGSFIREAAAALAGSGAVSPAGSSQMGAQTSLSASGTLSSIAGIDYIGLIILDGSGTLSAIPSVAGTQEGAASLLGSGALAALAGADLRVLSALAGAGTISPAGGITFSLSSSLAGSGSLVALQSLDYAGIAALSGSGDLAALSVVTFSGAIALPGSGSLVADGSVLGQVLASAALAGSGSLSGAGILDLSALSGLVSSGTLVSLGSVTLSGILVLPGTGTLIAEGSTEAIKFGAASLLGNGLVAAAPQVILSGISSFSGAGSILSAANTSLAGAVSLDGAATITPSPAVTYLVVIALAGSGAVSATPDVTPQNVPGDAAVTHSSPYGISSAHILVYRADPSKGSDYDAESTH